MFVIRTNIEYDDKTKQFFHDAYIMPIDGVIINKVDNWQKNTILLCRSQGEISSQDLLNEAVRQLNRHLRKHAQLLN